MEEQLDYYFNEEGLMVFTAAYHLKRGYCCKNGCKHCPWNYGTRDRKPESKEDGRSGRLKLKGES